MNKLLSIALSALLIGTGAALVGCGEKSDDGKIEIVCTTFPLYDWVKNLTEGDDFVTITVLQTSGADLHNYQPTFADTVKIYNCDMFVYVGGESDQWAEPLLKSSSANPDMLQVNLLEALGERALIEEEIGEDHQEEDHGEDELDEHVWLSLKNANVLCAAITEKLCALNAENASLYQSNLDGYAARIDELETEYSTALSSTARRTLLFADRFPFRYLAEDYSLNYYAAFSGCSAETEASPEVILSLIKALNENQLPYVMILDGSSRDIAQKIIDESATKDQQILVINSLQSVTKAQIANGANYLDLMRDNLNVLITALN